MLWTIAENYPKIQGIHIFRHKFLYNAYADHPLFFPKEVIYFLRILGIKT